jgi:dihydroxy-acid dehydratase
LSPRYRSGDKGVLSDGDAITIDARAKTISVDLSIAEIAKRRKSWKPREIAYATGALAKYARLVSSASRGAVTG